MLKIRNRKKINKGIVVRVVVRNKKKMIKNRKSTVIINNLAVNMTTTRNKNTTEKSMILARIKIDPNQMKEMQINNNHLKEKKVFMDLIN